jgi:hypothetical protein
MIVSFKQNFVLYDILSNTPSAWTVSHSVHSKVDLASDQRTPAQYFNTAAFTTAPQLTLGNASRNPVRGPACRYCNIALIKHTGIGDHADLELRGEVFNLTNPPALSQPNGSYGSAAFGSITSTATDPRVVQFAMRVSY